MNESFSLPHVKPIGQTAIFYLPADKLPGVRDHLHHFLLLHYDAYTFESSNIQGYWRSNPDSPLFHDQNVKYVVSFEGRERVNIFVDFLADLCGQIGEECIYLTMGMKSYLVRPRETS